MNTLVGRKAPDFTCAAVLPNGEITNTFNLTDHTKGKNCLIFFYPLDFTFVCPSELIALDKRMNEFKKRNVEVITVSVDSQFTHNAWRNTAYKNGGIEKVQFTMAADVNHRIAQAFGVEHPEAGVSFRGAYLIDRNGLIRVQIVNDLPIGRNIDELLRLFDAINFHEEHGEVCPAGWQEGKKGMKPNAAGVASYLTENQDQL